MITADDLEVAARYQAFVRRRLDRFVAAHPGPLPTSWWPRTRRIAGALRVAVDLVLAARSVELSVGDGLRIVAGELQHREVL